MSDEQLKVDLAALGKLSPQLQGLGAKLTKAASAHPGGESGRSPATVAIGKLVSKSIPNLQRTLAARLNTVADLSAQTVTQFGDTEEHVTQTIRSAAGLALTREVPVGER
ncbi:Uncharacterised protein [Mycobacteroides abscessus subsp. abscessus]|uniref:Uncharacterized protein n=1 Tax=Mycobacteroides abscessus TaxID=36809 RepID=A0AB33TD49_9MYCO|nr:hypothetical protein [Mycobacteroides abscessus]MDO3014830.1 hypothetical protein [Mycobacteroides abscessus subsp. abscessus]MDO3086283.1 hypothetical protein [Mycobacteroides abscessus subsp. abscessus]MDO3170186.1 hypothetical protein [Mycobacteroides abscessus subsp. abscessus]RIR85330.1 hypothetical protein D2E57_22335 [Mycobacteroides abscessus]CPT23775.1 Hypothetical protein ERS075531_01219 [Mycobacteroides abscessus]